MRENLTKGPGSPGASGPWKQGPWKQVLVTEDPEPVDVNAVFRWLSESGDLVDLEESVEGAVDRDAAVIRIVPSTLALEEVAADLPVFESPFSLSPAFLRLCPANTNVLPGLGADPEGIGSGWNDYNASVSADTFNAPWAGHTGDGLIPSVDTNFHTCSHYLNAMATAPGRRVFASGVLAPAASGYAAFGVGVMSEEDNPGTQFSVPYVLVNFTTGTIEGSGDFLGGGAEPVNTWIRPLAGGSFQVGLEFLVPAGGNWVYCSAVAANASGNPAFAGDGVTVYSNFWGFTLRQQGGWQPFTNQATERAADAVSWPLPEAVATALGDTGTLLFEFSPTVAAAHGPGACNLVAVSDSAGSLLYFDGTDLASTDGTSTATASLAFTQGGRYWVAVEWDKDAGILRIGTSTDGETFSYGEEAPFAGFPTGESLHLGYSLAWAFYAGRVVILDGIITDEEKAEFTL